MKFRKITAFLLSALTVCSCLTGCAGKNKETDSSQNDTSIQTTVSQTKSDSSKSESDAEPLAETEPPATEHISPREEMKIQSGVQKDYTDVVLNHDTNKIYPVQLSDFLQAGDSVQKFVFEFEADGNIGTYQGGCGISVDASCQAATDDYWYQSQDFSVQADGSRPSTTR